MTKLETVSTHDLAEGDCILYYGVTFRLRDRKEHAMRAGDNPETQGVCVTFRTDVVADASNGFFPKSWLKDWTVQGNGMARWARLVDPQIAEFHITDANGDVVVVYRPVERQEA